MRLTAVFLGAVLLSTIFTVSPAGAPASECEGLPLEFTEDFEQGVARWEMTDPQAWEVLAEGDNHVLALTKPSNYEPVVRSPKNIARVKDLNLCTFIMDVTLKQTGREYGHRDLCLFLNYRDPSHFYYVHLASKADEHANSIFLVNGAPRVSIAKERTAGTKWDDQYHRVRIKRMAQTGRIEVFFDEMDKPVMMAEDKTFVGGAVGVGSFDDQGNFDDITVWGIKPCPAAVDCAAGKAAPENAPCQAAPTAGEPGAGKDSGTAGK